MNVFFQTYKPLHTLADTSALSYKHNEGFLPNVRYITHTCLYHHTKLHAQGRFLSEHVNRHTLGGTITLSYTHYAGFFSLHTFVLLLYTHALFAHSLHCVCNLVSASVCNGLYVWKKTFSLQRPSEQSVLWIRNYLGSGSSYFASRNQKLSKIWIGSGKLIPDQESTGS